LAASNAPMVVGAGCVHRQQGRPGHAVRLAASRNRQRRSQIHKRVHGTGEDADHQPHKGLRQVPELVHQRRFRHRRPVLHAAARAGTRRGGSRCARAPGCHARSCAPVQCPPSGPMSPRPRSTACSKASAVCGTDPPACFGDISLCPPLSDNSVSPGQRHSRRQGGERQQRACGAAQRVVAKRRGQRCVPGSCCRSLILARRPALADRVAPWRSANPKK
jgi:hypothetical protein